MSHHPADGWLTLLRTKQEHLCKGHKGRQLPTGTRPIPEIKTNRGEQKIFILSPDDMIQANYADLVKIAGFNDFFWQAPASHQ